MFESAVAAWGVVEATPASLPALREQPGRTSRRPIPPRLARYADEQTVVGLAAVLRAIEEHRLDDTCFDDWGVLAAPRFPGRIGGAAVLARFLKDGLGTLSPHVLPQYALHSLSSAISIALGMRGPNFGIGGGLEALAEGLTVALTFLDHAALPGLWLVLTQWTPEPRPDGVGGNTVDSVCTGVAMALVPGPSQGLVLRMTTPSYGRLGDEADLHAGAARPPHVPTLPELAAQLTASPPWAGLVRWACPMPWGGQIELCDHMQRQSKAA